MIHKGPWSVLFLYRTKNKLVRLLSIAAKLFFISFLADTLHFAIASTYLTSSMFKYKLCLISQTLTLRYYDISSVSEPEHKGRNRNFHFPEIRAYFLHTTNIYIKINEKRTAARHLTTPQECTKKTLSTK